MQNIITYLYCSDIKVYFEDGKGSKLCIVIRSWMIAERCSAHHRKKKKERKIQSSKTRFRKENWYAMEQEFFR
jgi:hypothetical protein